MRQKPQRHETATTAASGDTRRYAAREAIHVVSYLSLTLNQGWHRIFGLICGLCARDGVGMIETACNNLEKRTHRENLFSQTP
jgi:hypothetical protein